MGAKVAIFAEFPIIISCFTAKGSGAGKPIFRGLITLKGEGRKRKHGNRMEGSQFITSFNVFIWHYNCIIIVLK